MNRAPSPFTLAITPAIRRWFIAAILPWALGLGCAANLDFNSPSPLGTGVNGKVWQTPYYIDTALYTPGAQTVTDALGSGSTTANVQALVALDFAVASSGGIAQLVGTWWDSSTANTYRGYARQYTDGTGWASLGPDFGQIASDGLISLATATVAAGPGGFFMANFFSQTGSLDSASASHSSSGWQSSTNNTGLGHVPTYALDPVTFNGASHPVSVVDSLGRGFVFFTDVTGVWETQWGVANPTGISSTINPVSSTDTVTESALTAHFDGAKQVCALYELSSNTLTANCQDVSRGGPYSFPLVGATAQITSIDTGISGHDSATDGAGHIMTVYYKGSGSTFHIYASLGTNAAWSTTAVRLDAGLTDTFGSQTAYTDATLWPAGTRPGVAYVGAGKYLAVWIGHNASLKATQLFSALYDPAIGWQSAAAVAGTLETYSLVPHAQRLTVFGNGAGNAGYALNKIYYKVTAVGTVVYPEAAQVRVTELNRWQQDNLWIGSKTFTDFPCFNELNGAAAKTDSGKSNDCRRAPAGVILPSGNTLVFFMSQDGYSQTVYGASLPGNRRVTAAEFK